MRKYKISVIIIYNNCADTLESCLKSVLRLPVRDMEVICADNGSSDRSKNIVLKYEPEYKFIKPVSFPEKNDEQQAKEKALLLASGEFVYFLDGKTDIDSDFIDKLFANSKAKSNFEYNHVYKRSFIENRDDLYEMVQAAVSEKTAEIEQQNNKLLKSIENSLSEFEKICADNIQNKAYDLTTRINRHENDYRTECEKISSEAAHALNEAYKYFHEENQKIHDSLSKIYNDISAVYEYIKDEINLKGGEIGKVYEEITKNYHYTEDLIESKLRNFYVEKIENTEKDNILRHINFKRITDMRFDEVNSKIKAINSGVTEPCSDYISIEKLFADNMENVYERINKSSKLFYEELTEIYSGLNNKINKLEEEEKYLRAKQLTELKEEILNDFNEKINDLKKEIDG